MDFNMEQMKRDRMEAFELCKKNKLRVIPNSSPELRWSMPEGIQSGHLIAFLERKAHKRGIDRLKALSKIMNHPGLAFCDYTGEDIIKWINKEPWRQNLFCKGIFHEAEEGSPEWVEERRNFISNIPVYINGCFGELRDEEDDDNEYCKKEYPEKFKAVIDHFSKNKKSHDEVDRKMAWFWCGEF